MSLPFFDHAAALSFTAQAQPCVAGAGKWKKQPLI
jgi:hypothetical protein